MSIGPRIGRRQGARILSLYSWFGGKLFHCLFFFLSLDVVDIWDLVYLWADLVSRDLDLVLPILDTALGVAVMAEQGSAVWSWGRRTRWYRWRGGWSIIVMVLQIVWLGVGGEWSCSGGDD